MAKSSGLEVLGVSRDLVEPCFFASVFLPLGVPTGAGVDRPLAKGVLVWDGKAISVVASSSSWPTSSSSLSSTALLTMDDLDEDTGRSDRRATLLDRDDCRDLVSWGHKNQTVVQIDKNDTETELKLLDERHALLKTMEIDW